MEEKQQEICNLQWHPALFADIQIELEDEAENLIFENEHQLGTKPKMIDILVKKKNKNIPVRKNIGQIFRGHNLIEYKSPTDYLNVDDFYKTYAYACFYKADTAKADAISIEEITITFICYACPRKLIKHLREERGYTVCEREKGIYHIFGDILPMQILVIPSLSDEKNFWLSSLTDDLQNQQKVNRLLSEYEKHTDNNLYQSVMDIIVRANKEKFMEVNPKMCQALVEIMEEIMKDELEERARKATERGMQAGMQKGMQAGMQKGMQVGIQKGEDGFARLSQILLENNCQDQLLKAVEDKEYRKELYLKYGIS